jgi:hypothetical protein
MNINKFLSLVYLLSSILILSYVFYKSEIVHNGKVNYTFKYIFSIFSIIFSLIFIKLNLNLKKNISILIFTTFCSLIIVDIYLYKSQFQSVGNYEESHRINFFENYKEKYDKEATMVITPFNFINVDKKIFPLSGLSNKTTIYCNENGYYSVYNSDRYGFNNDDELWNEKQINTLLIGDSFTHGACVNHDDSIAGNLNKLSKKKIINLGMGSTGPLLQLAILREYGKIIDFKNLIWFYFEGNDYYELENELSDNILIKYFNNNNFSQNLIDRNLEKDKFLDIFFKKEFLKTKEKINKNENIYFKFFKLFHLRMFIISLINHQEPDFIKINQIFQKVKSITSKNEINFYIVYLPSYERYKNNHKKYEKSKQELIRISSELDIKFIDIDKIFKSQDPLKFFPKGGGHYNELGYLKVSEIVFRQMR